MAIVDRHASTQHLVAVAARLVQSAACAACNARINVRIQIFTTSSSHNSVSITIL
jgi:hypothetical protein